jgi:hypothetical protein
MTQDAEGLKACPLNCNGRVLHEEIAGRGYRIQCQKCGCALESPTLRFATMLWNDRVPSPVSALVEALPEKLTTIEQTFLEVRHAQHNGPGWYTKGEPGLYSQVRMWLGRGSEAVADIRTALANYKKATP